MEKFNKQMLRMLMNERGSAWMKFEYQIAYIRVGKQMINDQLTNCVQIANVNTPVKNQRQGMFTRMIEHIKTMTRIPIYVENVHNTEFRDALLKNHGYVVARVYDGVIYDVVLLRDN